MSQFFNFGMPTPKHKYVVFVNTTLHNKRDSIDRISYSGFYLIRFLKSRNYDVRKCLLFERKNTNTNKWETLIFFTDKKICQAVQAYAKEKPKILGEDVVNWSYQFWKPLEELTTELINGTTKQLHVYGNLSSPIKIHVDRFWINEDTYEFWDWVEDNLKSSLIFDGTNLDNGIYFQSEQDMAWFALKWGTQNE